MDKTRTSLQKWHAAIECLSENTYNATQLANAIGVTHKVAWTMLRKLRAAIEEAENARKFEGDVSAGVWALAPKYIWIFLPDRIYFKERVVSLFTALDRSGHPIIKVEPVSPKDLVDGTKLLANEGKKRLRTRLISSDGTIAWLNKAQMSRSPLMKRFEELRCWLHEHFNGVGTKYLPQYLAEFTFRWNAASRRASLREEWYRVCFSS